MTVVRGEQWCECAHGFILVNEDALEYKDASFDDENYQQDTIQVPPPAPSPPRRAALATAPPGR